MTKPTQEDIERARAVYMIHPVDRIQPIAHAIATARAEGFRQGQVRMRETAEKGLIEFEAICRVQAFSYPEGETRNALLEICEKANYALNDMRALPVEEP